VTARNEARAGFTLAELLVILAVIALSLAVVGPRIFGGEGRTIETAVERLEGAAARTRALARRTGADAVMQVDLGAGVITIEPQGEVIRLPELDGLEARVAEDEIDGRIYGVRFFPEGGATGGRYDLELGEQRRRVMIDWLTGRTRHVTRRE
jgi:general secretion pathway protein H